METILRSDAPILEQAVAESQLQALDRLQGRLQSEAAPVESRLSTIRNRLRYLAGERDRLEAVVADLRDRADTNPTGDGGPPVDLETEMAKRRANDPRARFAQTLQRKAIEGADEEAQRRRGGLVEGVDCQGRRWVAEIAPNVFGS